MASYEELHSEAFQAYRSGQCRYASLKFQEAATRARALNDEGNWFSSTVWAAEAEYLLGRYSLAQSLLLRSAMRVSDNRDFERWIYYRLRFLVSAQWRPRKQDLAAAIDNLKEELRRFRYARRDFDYCRLLFFQMQGEWQAALACGEKAFHEDDSEGVVQLEVARMCADLCIRLKRYSAAEEWIEAIHVESEWRRGWNEFILVRQSECRLRLARARGDDIATVNKRLRDFKEKARVVDDFNSAFARTDAELRVSLADPACGDPAQPWHPARVICRARLATPLNIHHRYTWHLHVLDYRLACVRYGLGLPAVDEEHQGPPEAPLTVTPGVDHRRSLQRAEVALFRVIRFAARLDGMLVCAWRMAEVARRERWLSALREAYEATLHRY